MKITELASVSLKMLGIYCFIKIIPIVQAIVDTQNLKNIQSFDPSADFSTIFTGSIVSLFLYILLGLCLLFFGDKIAVKISPKNSYSESDQTTESKTLQAIAISVVGLLVVALAIPKIMQFGVNAYSMRAYTVEPHLTQKLSVKNVAFIVGALSQFFVGLLLFIGSSFIAHFWYKFLNRIEFEKSLK